MRLTKKQGKERVVWYRGLFMNFSMKAAALAVALGVSFGMPAIASAQAPAATAPVGQPIGTVSGVQGQVTVVRGSQTFTLSNGNQVFAGDRILTGANSSVNVTVNGVSKALVANQSIIVNPATFAAAVPTTLGAGVANAGVAAAGTGNILPVLGAVAAAGAGAAALSDGGSSSP